MSDCTFCGHAKSHHTQGKALPKVGVCGYYAAPDQCTPDAVATVLERYFVEVRQDGYIVDGVDSDEAAEAVMEAIQSWDTLMWILDRHYPADVFPTMEDREDRDPGPRIISLIRHLNQARSGGES